MPDNGRYGDGDVCLPDNGRSDDNDFNVVSLDELISGFMLLYFY